jgi:hypothetical protein
LFLWPNYTPAEAGGPGYVDDDGRPRAGVNLMGFRDLVRRTATMMHVMGKRPLTYLHMTNVNIVPMHAFGTINLDWEWRDQGHFKTMHVQDRVSLDEILAHNLGLQSGNVPVAITGGHIHGFGWLTRTLLAVCVPHEMRIHNGMEPVSFVQTELARFGYGMPDCRVFRYWEEGFPLKAEGAEMRALVLARKGKAMIALGNFGPTKTGGTTTVKTTADGPSLEEYDAGQRGLAKAPTTPAAPVAPQAKAENYTVRFKLDLAALGLAESAQAWDVELKAGRKKVENPVSFDAPSRPASGIGILAGDNGVDIDIELEERVPGLLKRLAPGVFELTIPHHDFALIVVE